MPLSADSRFTASGLYHVTDPSGGGNDCSIFALDSTHWYVTFAAYSGTNQVVYLVYTTDGGTTWLGAGGAALPVSGGSALPIVIDSTPSNSGNVFFFLTQVWARDANKLLVTYNYVDFNNQANNNVRVAVSTTGPLGFPGAGSNTVIQTGNTNASSFFDNGTEGFLVTCNYNDGNNYLYKTNDLVTWTSPITIDTSPVSNLLGVFSSYVNIWGAGSNLFLAFEWFRGVGVIVSSDCGSTWSSTKLNNWAPNSSDAFGFRVRSKDGNTAYLAGVINSANFYVKTTDGGSTWGSPVILDSGQGGISSTTGLVLANSREWLFAAGESQVAPQVVALYDFLDDSLAAGGTPPQNPGERYVDSAEPFVGNHVADFVDMTAIDASTVLIVNYHNANIGGQSNFTTNTVVLNRSNQAITNAFTAQTPHTCSVGPTVYHGESLVTGVVKGEKISGALVSGETSP